MTAAKIRREIESFQHSVKILSNGIRQSGAKWNDNKYKDLAELIHNIASSSKQVIVSCDRVCDMLDKFEKIGREKY